MKLNNYMSATTKANGRYKTIPTKLILKLSNAEMAYYLSVRKLHKMQDGKPYTISSISIEESCGISVKNQNNLKLSLETKGALKFNKSDTGIEFTFENSVEPYLMLRIDQMQTFLKDRSLYMDKLRALAIVYTNGTMLKSKDLMKIVSRNKTLSLIKISKQYADNIELYESLSDGSKINPIVEEARELVSKPKKQAKITFSSDFTEAVQFMNKTFVKAITWDTKANDLLTSILRTNTLDDVKKVVTNRQLSWFGNDTMEQHLRPQTVLKRDNFNKYLIDANADKETLSTIHKASIGMQEGQEISLEQSSKLTQDDNLYVKIYDLDKLGSRLGSAQKRNINGKTLKQAIKSEHNKLNYGHMEKIYIYQNN